MTQIDFEKQIQPFKIKSLKKLPKTETLKEIYDGTSPALIVLYDSDIKFISDNSINRNRFIRVHIHRIIEDLKEIKQSKDIKTVKKEIKKNLTEVAGLQGE